MTSWANWLAAVDCALCITEADDQGGATCSNNVLETDVEEGTHRDMLEETENDQSDSSDLDNEVFVDLVQQTSLLFIPTLVKCRSANESSFTDGEEGSTLPFDQASHRNNGRSCFLSSSMDKTESESNAEMLIGWVLAFALAETDVDFGDELTVDRLRNILKALGEVWPDTVLKEMINACHDKGESENEESSIDDTIVVNETTFLRGLTADIHDKYNIQDETMLSTLFEDAISRPGITLKRNYTASNIDYVADTYRDFAWQVLSWFTLTTTFYAYLFEYVTPKSGFPKLECQEGEFGCPIVNGIIAWLDIFLKLSIFGFLFMFGSTQGNSIYLLETTKWIGLILMLLGIFVVLWMTVMPFFFNYEVPYLANNRPNGNSYLTYVAVALGLILFLVQIIQLVRLYLPKTYYQGLTSSTKRLRHIFIPGALKRMRRTKLAMTCKVQRLIDNALLCHEKGESSYSASTSLTGLDRSVPAKDYAESLREESRGRSFLADSILWYHANNMQRETVGGVLWTWRMFWTRQIYNEEGFWLNTRLISANVIQVVVVFALLVIGIVGVHVVDVSQISWMNGEVTQQEFTVAFLWGAAPAVVAASTVAVVYIPSAVSTVLRYRSGVLGSLKDKHFLQNRHAMDTTVSATWVRPILPS